MALVRGTDKVKIRRLAVVFFERMKEDTCSIIIIIIILFISDLKIHI